MQYSCSRHALFNSLGTTNPCKFREIDFCLFIVPVLFFVDGENILAKYVLQTVALVLHNKSACEIGTSNKSSLDKLRSR